MNENPLAPVGPCLQWSNLEKKLTLDLCYEPYVNQIWNPDGEVQDYRLQEILMPYVRALQDTTGIRYGSYPFDLVIEFQSSGYVDGPDKEDHRKVTRAYLTMQCGAVEVVAEVSSDVADALFDMYEDEIYHVPLN